MLKCILFAGEPNHTPMKLKPQYTTFVLFFVLVLPATVFAQFQVRHTHPRIFLDSTILTRLTARAAANTAEWQQVVARTQIINTLTVSQIVNQVFEPQHYAFSFALSWFATGNISHRDTAIAIFTQFFNTQTTDSSMYRDVGYDSRSLMVEMATLYDWLYNDLPEPFRSNVRQRLIHWANFILTDPAIYGIWGQPYFFEGNNYSVGHLVGITCVGYAVHSEDTAAGNYLIHVSDSMLPQFKQFANTRLQYGDANEGWGYGAGYALSYFRILAIVNTATTNQFNHFATTTYDEDVAWFLPNATLPDLAHMLPEGDWARESTGELWDYHRAVADLVSTYSDDTLMRAVARFWGTETVPVSAFVVTAYRWLPFLFSNQEITPVDYRTVPAYSGRLYTDTTGTDQFVQRNNWLPGAQWVSFRGGGRYGDHAHNGHGHFSLYENGWLLIDENIQSASGINGMDSVHNTIHFDGMCDDEMYPFDDFVLAENSRNIRRDFTADYSYLWHNMSDVYTRREFYFNTVVNNERQFFYLPALRTFAVFDLTETEQPQQGKWFALHYNGTPQLSNDSSFSTYANAQTRVFAHTCFPLAQTVTLSGNMLRTKAATASARTNFLHLIYTDAATATARNVTPVCRDNGRVLASDFYGAHFNHPQRDYCLMFAGNNPLFNYDSLVYEVPYSALIPQTHYVAGVNVNTTYHVSFSGVSGQLRITVTLNPHSNSTPIISTAGGILEINILTVSTEEIVAVNTTVFYSASTSELVVQKPAQYEPMQISICNTLGQEVLKQQCVAEHTRILCNTLPAGVYVASVYSTDGTSETISFCR
jgi:hypothetical protein